MDKILKEIFHYDSFRQGQKEIIEQILADKDVLAILPTGNGKSLCYQYPAYTRSGLIVIICPLISLMNDQIEQMQLRGEKRAIAFNSQLTYQEKKEVLHNLSSYRFFFISPELIRQEEVLATLKKTKIQSIVVDEAHCISQWGVDFRPDYYQLPYILESLNQPQVIALTATATPTVIADIRAILFSKKNPVEIQYSVYRSNLHYLVEKEVDKRKYIIDFLEKYAGPGIIYFSSKKEAQKMALELKQLGYAAAYYHGDMMTEDRLKIQQQFLQDQLEILCATTAFGMGVNKPNIRFVIHYHLPASLENFIQESGRAGRDGKPALSILLYKEEDISLQRLFIREAYQELFDLFIVDPKWQSDLQKRWLHCLQDIGYQKEDFIRLFKKKEKERYQQLKAMVDFVETPYSRIQFIQRYFAEPQVFQYEQEMVVIDDILEPRKKSLTQPQEFSAYHILYQLFQPMLEKNKENHLESKNIGWREKKL